MVRMLSAAAAALALMLAPVALAAEGAKVGEPAPQFTLENVVTGEAVSLSDHKDKTVVVVWQSTQCPWNAMDPKKGYERVLAPLAKEWQDKDVVFLAINSNKTESKEEIASYVKEHELPYPVLKDSGNKIADAYGATHTPHFFVVSSGEQVLEYKGGFEQVPTSPGKCGEMDEKYLVPVLEALAAGEEPPHRETMSKGCTIKRD